MFTTLNPPVALTLKQQTGEYHAALENWLLPRLTGIRSHADYAALLKAFYGFYKPLETAIEQWVAETVVPDIRQRRKADSILLDLAALPAANADLPLCRQLPPLPSVAAALGALYVLEGSTLGGRGITRLLLKNEAAGLQAAHLRFFDGYGPQTGQRWTAFLAVLDAAATDNNAVGAMVAAANQTFLLFHQWLQKTLCA